MSKVVLAIRNSPAQSQPALFESGLGRNVYFSGETPFFSFSRALRVIGQENLTGTLRSAGARDNVDLYAREGKVVLVTTRDGEAYCAEAPVTLVNIDSERVREARETQSQTGCPLFITLVTGRFDSARSGPAIGPALWPKTFRPTVERPASPFRI